MLVVRGPTYYSQGDEKVFFDWLQSISCVEGVGGRLRDVHITLKSDPGRYQLWELIALFYRYRMNMKPLAALKTNRNAAWFDDSKMFWHARVFGSAVGTKLGRPRTGKRS
jgi:hypothetical protein